MLWAKHREMAGFTYLTTSGSARSVPSNRFMIGGEESKVKTNWLSRQPSGRSMLRGPAPLLVPIHIHTKVVSYTLTLPGYNTADSPASAEATSRPHRAI